MEPEPGPEPEPEPVVIRDGACQYRIIKPIGTWGPDFNLTVYEAVILPETNNLPHVALKMVSNTDEMGPYYDFAAEDIKRITFFTFLPHTILPIKKHFDAPLNNVENHCTVLLFDAQVTSVRSLMSSRPMFADGIPQTCIAVALSKTLAGLSEIHDSEECHEQITAGNIYYHHKDETIKLGYAASAYERTVTDPEPEPLQPSQFQAAAHDHEASSSNPIPDPIPIQEAPTNLMLEWARPPEVERDEDFGIGYIYPNIYSDIWLIGIVALELAYGRIRVANREEMLKIAAYISRNKRLPNTWQELRMRAAGAQIPWSSVSIFTESFGHFVGTCLAFDPERRPLTDVLQRHIFLRKNSESMTYFENVVVKGLSPPVGRAARDRKRFYRKLSRHARERRRRMLWRRRSNLAVDEDDDLDW